MRASLLITSLLATAACSSATNTGSENENPTGGHLAIVNALTGSASGATLVLDGSTAALPAPGASVGFPLAAGAHHMELRWGADAQIADFTISEGTHQVAMVATNGTSTGARLLLGRESSDTASTPPTSGAKIRAVSLADGQPDYYTYLYPVGGTVDSSTSFVFPFRYGTGTDARFPGYAVRPAGSYRFRVAAAGTTTTVIESDVITLGEGQVWSVVLSLKADGGLQLQAVRDNNERTQ